MSITVTRSQFIKTTVHLLATIFYEYFYGIYDSEYVYSEFAEDFK